MTFEQISFDSTVPRKIRFGTPYRAIFYDNDGTLTGKGAGSWASYFYASHLVPECEHKQDEYDGVICDNTVQIRRLAFHSAKKAGEFTGMALRAILWDDSVITAMDNATLDAYKLNMSNYGNFDFKEKSDPMNGWAVPFVTGHKYKVHWGTGIPMEEMKISISENWELTDKPVEFVFNHTQERAAINVTYEGTLIANESIPTDKALYSSGQNKHRYSDKELDLVVMGTNHTANNIYKETLIKLEAIMPVVTEVVVINDDEADYRMWSNASNWPNGQLPQAGDNVEIPSGWKMILDIEETPVFTMLSINGKLYFSD